MHYVKQYMCPIRYGTPYQASPRSPGDPDRAPGLYATGRARGNWTIAPVPRLATGEVCQHPVDYWAFTNAENESHVTDMV